MKYTYLGQTQLYVSRIALGLWQAGGDWGAVDEAKETATIRRALDLGINFFDTAQAYGFGASERQLGAALSDKIRAERDKIVIATKGGLRQTSKGLVRDSSPAWLRKGIESSLRALGTDHVDLYQVHWPDPRDAVCRDGRRSERVRTPRESTICWRLELQHRRTRRIGPVQACRYPSTAL